MASTSTQAKNQFDEEFWDKKYASSEPQEWLLGYSDVKTFFEGAVKNKDAKVLVLGCGDAPFSGDLYAAGYHNVTNVDNSSVCIESMTKKHPEMTWMVADATAMDSIEDESFEVIIEKTLIDNFFAAPAIDKDEAITNLWAETWRVLQPGGMYISLNFIMDSAVEKGHTQKCLQSWTSQIGEAMGRPPWRILPINGIKLSNLPNDMHQEPALFLCKKPADLSMKQLG